MNEFLKDSKWTADDEASLESAFADVVSMGYDRSNIVRLKGEEANYSGIATLRGMAAQFSGEVTVYSGPGRSDKFAVIGFEKPEDKKIFGWKRDRVRETLHPSPGFH